MPKYKRLATYCVNCNQVQYTFVRKIIDFVDYRPRLRWLFWNRPEQPSGFWRHEGDDSKFTVKTCQGCLKPTLIASTLLNDVEDSAKKLVMSPRGV